jgi:hypothetical protein
MPFIIDQEKVLKDLKRCLAYYQSDNNYYSDREYVDIEEFVYWLKVPHWFGNHLKVINDLSEDFIREFSQYWDCWMDEEPWKTVATHQTKLSEQFYEDFLHEFDKNVKVYLIHKGRISGEFIKKHSEAFDQEVWEKVYE